MTGQIRKHLTVSFESSPNEIASSDVARTFAESSTRNDSSEIPPPDPALRDGAHSSHASSDVIEPSSHGFEPELESIPGELPSFPGLPSELKQALRAGRTPLIEGVDYGSPAYEPAAQAPSERERAELPKPDKARVDTLSPSESVPPPAPYLASGAVLRPSIVPPVRSPYVDLAGQRVPGDVPPAGLRSEPPPRIPISDRPPRIGARSDPPPRLSHSEPPPSPVAAVPSSRRKAIRDLPLVDSPEALRRDAVTIPADTHPVGQSGGMDPARSIAARVPTFSSAPLPYTMRQHENNQLRNVAMAMMFVIFIVTGAIAGIRWFVARESERGVPNPSIRVDLSNRVDPSAQKGVVEARQPRIIEQRAHETTAETGSDMPTPSLDPTPARSAAATSVPSTPPKPISGQGAATKAVRTPDLNERDPWGQPKSRTKRSSSSRASSANEVDTQTPLFSPRQ